MNVHGRNNTVKRDRGEVGLYSCLVSVGGTVSKGEKRGENHVKKKQGGLGVLADH